MIQRRQFLNLSLGAAAVTLAGRSVWAEEGPINIGWADLMPGDAPEDDRLLGIVEHGQPVLGSSELVTEYNGKIVRLPGYMVPLDFAPEGVRDFILVPFIGACIHVPPPPPNQLVLVRSETPYPANGYFEAVNVTGVFNHLDDGIEMAEIGYEIAADDVSAFEY